MEYLVLLMVVLLSSVFIMPLLTYRRGHRAWKIALLSSASAFALTLLSLPSVLAGKVVTYNIAGWSPLFGIVLAVDYIGILLMVLVTGVGLAAVVTSRHVISHKRTEYYALLLLLIAGLSGIVLTGDIFNLFVFFELMSISSYALTAYVRDRQAVTGSIKYLVMGSFSTSLILLGIALLYGLTGTLNMADLSIALQEFSGHTAARTALALLLAGFALKAAVVPFHAWKPKVIEVSPTPVAMVFTAASTSVGVYTIYRLLFTIYGTALSPLLIGLGLLTMVVGALVALQQTDLKRLLAYSAISQVGYVLVGLAAASFSKSGAVAGVFHLANLVVIDMLLFIPAAFIIARLGTSSMAAMGGLSGVRELSIPFLAGVLALAGVPLLNGFSSKWLLYTAYLGSYPSVAVIAMLVSIITLAYGLKAYQLVFQGRPRRINIDVPPEITYMLAGLVAVAVFLGAAPQVGYQLAERIVDTTVNSGLYAAGVLL